MSKGRRPVWLIGLDGVSFDILQPMIDAGRLPTLTDFMTRGTAGILKSNVVPFTPQAWATVITGANPGRHGVFGFVRQMPGRPPEFLSSKTMRGERLWTWFSRRGLKNLVINVPLTYPPEPLNGIMITGMMTPSESSQFTYPSELKARMAREWPGYRVDVRASIDKSRNLAFLDELEGALAVSIDLMTTLVKEVDPDFFFPVFVMPDRIQHVFGHLIHPASAAYDGATAKKWRSRIWDSYAKLDAAIGRLLDLAPPEANVLFISDHGFAMERGGFFTNDFLSGLGLLKLKTGGGHGTARLIVRKFNTPAIKRLVPNILVRKTIDLTKGAIDWSKTAAYAASAAQQGISINLLGREPEGTVSPADYDGVRDRIIEALASVSRADTGEPAVKACRREDIFYGPFLEAIPDIVLSFEESRLEAKDAVLGADAVTLSDGGSRAIHHRDGIFIACGPSIEPGPCEELNLEDIAPTVLALAGIEAPVGLDGSVGGQVVQRARSVRVARPDPRGT
ncbi:MAG: alkaline phosphatase family protein [Actinomycetota bacterium]|nr:alkaline phosphatase family protein [Actinomycetota bacterium]